MGSIAPGAHAGSAIRACVSTYLDLSMSMSTEAGGSAAPPTGHDMSSTRHANSIEHGDNNPHASLRQLELDSLSIHQLQLLPWHGDGHMHGGNPSCSMVTSAHPPAPGDTSQAVDCDNSDTDGDSPSIQAAITNPNTHPAQTGIKQEGINCTSHNTNTSSSIKAGSPSQCPHSSNQFDFGDDTDDTNSHVDPEDELNSEPLGTTSLHSTGGANPLAGSSPTVHSLQATISMVQMILLNHFVECASEECDSDCGGAPAATAATATATATATAGDPGPGETLHPPHHQHQHQHRQQPQQQHAHIQEEKPKGVAAHVKRSVQAGRGTWGTKAPAHGGHKHAMHSSACQGRRGG